MERLRTHKDHVLKASNQEALNAERRSQARKGFEQSQELIGHCTACGLPIRRSAAHLSRCPSCSQPF